MYIYATYINFRHRFVTLLFGALFKASRVVHFYSSLASAPKTSTRPLLIRVLSIKWTNKKSETGSNTLEETAVERGRRGGGRIRSRARPDSQRTRPTQQDGSNIAEGEVGSGHCFPPDCSPALRRVDFVSNCTFCGSPRQRGRCLLPSHDGYSSRRFACSRISRSALFRALL